MIHFSLNDLGSFRLTDFDPRDFPSVEKEKFHSPDNDNDDESVNQLFGQDVLDFTEQACRMWMGNATRQGLDGMVGYLLGSKSVEDLPPSLQKVAPTLSSRQREWLQGAFTQSVYRDENRSLRELWSFRTRLSNIKHLPNDLRAWVNQAPLGEESARRVTAAAIRDAHFELTLDQAFTEFPPLPERISHLSIRNPAIHGFKGLPPLMNSLHWLEIRHAGKFQSFEALPPMPSLTTLIVHDEHQPVFLKDLPLGPALTTLDLRFNPFLVSLDLLPQGALDDADLLIKLDGCPLDGDSLGRIYQETHHADISYRDDIPRDSLRGWVKFWKGTPDHRAWRTMGTPHDRQMLAKLLGRLRSCRCFTDKALASEARADLRKLLRLIVSEPRFAAYGFLRSSQADSDCCDNVQSIFDDLRLNATNPVYGSHATMAEVIGFKRAQLVCELIDAYAGTLEGDLLESGQELKRVLCKELGLPIEFKKIQFDQLALVSRDIEGHKALARAYIEKHLTAEKLLDKLTGDEDSSDFLQTTFRGSFAAHHLMWSDLLEEVMAREGVLQTEEEDVAVIRSHDLGEHDIFKIAQNMAGLGDGKLFAQLQQQAKRCLLRALAAFCLEQPDRDLTSRQQGEWALLLSNPLWLAHLEKYGKSLGVPSFDKMALTRRALSEAGHGPG